jgi:uncharacterized protein
MSKKKTKPGKRTSVFKTWHKIAAVVIIVVFAAFAILNNLLKEETVQTKYVFTKEGELVFYDSLGNDKVRIDIEIADNEYERQLGLMFRDGMSENQGMLFIFPYQNIQSFWMRNTRISLDILFVNNRKEIVTIHKGTDILSERSYPSTQPSIYVVEVIAGFTDKYGIVEGDRVDWVTTELRLLNPQ